MELHIAEVFPGDPDGQTAANLESRQMISDVLRRGLDVSVREPTPVRQIEPVQPLNWKGELHENAFDCLRHTARQISPIRARQIIGLAGALALFRWHSLPWPMARRSRQAFPPSSRG
jgi:hypothetical protein